MKILWLSHIVPYPPKSGVLQRSYNLLKQTSKYNEIHLVSLNQKKILPTEGKLKEAIDALRQTCRSVDVFPIKSDKSKYHWFMMTTSSYFSRFPYDTNWLFNKDLKIFLIDLSKRDKFDLIHVDTIGMYQYAKSFTGTPIVLNHHNVESHMMFRRYEMEYNMFKKIYFKHESKKIKDYESEISSKCCLNLVVSDLDASRLREVVGHGNIIIIPNGVDLGYFHPQKPNENNCDGLIFAGPMDWYPNRAAVLFFLSDIWPKLSEDMPNLRATIIGRDPPKELIMAAREKKISAPGFVDDIRPYIDSAKIYICPIKDGGGTRLKILDALAMEKPLVATGMAVEGLDLCDGEHYLRAESGPDFVAQIKRLMNDNDLCKKIAAQGRRFIESRYSWEIIGDAIQTAYQKAIGSNTPSFLDRDGNIGEEKAFKL